MTEKAYGVLKGLAKCGTCDSDLVIRPLEEYYGLDCYVCPEREDDPMCASAAYALELEKAALILVKREIELIDVGSIVGLLHSYNDLTGQFEQELKEDGEKFAFRTSGKVKTALLAMELDDEATPQLLRTTIKHVTVYMPEEYVPGVDGQVESIVEICVATVVKERQGKTNELIVVRKPKKDPEDE